MSNKDYTKLFVEWLNSLEAGTTVRWGDDTLDLTKTWTAGWVDVIVPDFMKMYPDLGWILTFVDEAAEEYELASKTSYGWQIKVPYDLVVSYVRNKNTGETVLEAVAQSGVPLSRENESKLLAVLADPDNTLTTFGGWSVAAIHLAIAKWILTNSKGGSVVLSWDPTVKSAMYLNAVETLKRVESGEEQTYQVGENVWATGAVMDRLLEWEFGNE